MDTNGTVETTSNVNCVGIQCETIGITSSVSVNDIISLDGTTGNVGCNGSVSAEGGVSTGGTLSAAGGAFAVDGEGDVSCHTLSTASSISCQTLSTASDITCSGTVQANTFSGSLCTASSVNCDYLTVVGELRVGNLDTSTTLETTPVGCIQLRDGSGIPVGYIPYYSPLA